MKLLPCGLAAAVLLSSSLPALAKAYKFRTIHYKAADNIDPQDVNDAGVLVGNFAGNSFGCFTLTKQKKAVLTDPNGSRDSTSCYGINAAGTIVGVYSSPTKRLGFSYSGGVFTDIPGPAGSTFSQAEAINDTGAIIGTWAGADGIRHGYLFDGTTYTSFDMAGAANTYAEGINNAGDYTARGIDSKGHIRSYFVSGTSITELIFPNSTETIVNRINENGLIALGRLDSASVKHGGLYDTKTQTYYSVDVPGAKTTAILSVNGSQEIVGFYDLPGGSVDLGFRATGHVD